MISFLAVDAVIYMEKNVFKSTASRLMAVSLGVLLLSGCGTARYIVAHDGVVTSNAPGAARTSGNVPAVNAHYTVRGGDTLYGVARQSGMSVRQLAEMNGLAEPYRLYPGQQLRLQQAQPGQADAALNVARQEPLQMPAEVTTPAVTTVAAPALPASARSAGAGEVLGGQPAGQGWLWPSTGKVTASYSQSSGDRRGIDIIGKLGDPVYAAKSGTVVYAGNGLVGYGNLIIVKHDDEYLSAYAHSSRIAVSEGQQVKAGDKIAEIGSSGTDQTKLHFQIRREGKPVDPMRYLANR